MKKDRVEYSKTIQTGTPLNPSWEKAFIGATLDENEDPKESLEILKREVEEFHKGGNNGITVEWPIGKTYITGGGNELSGDLSKDISSCSSIKVLETYKLIAKTTPELKEIYDRKYEELKKVVS